MLLDIATATLDETEAVVNEMVVPPDLMNSAKSMKMMNSTAW